MKRLSVAVIAVASAAMLVGGCVPTIGDDDSRDRDPVSIGSPSATASSTASPTPSGTVTPTDEPKSCGKGEMLIKGVTIPGKKTKDLVIPEQTISGETIPEQRVAGVNIPPRRLPNQCVDVSPAPGGCLGKVTIPSATIPAVTIPAATIPGVHKAGIDIDAVTAAAVTAEAVTTESVTVDEVCQTEPKEAGEYVSSVYRSSLYRSSAYRSSVYRTSVYRPSGCNEAGECISGVRLPGVRVDGARLPGVRFPGKRLKGYRAGRADVYKGDGKIAYDVKADVLFDFGKADIKKRAVADLEKIAASIKEEVPDDKPVQVDGHTDAKGSAASNVTLSQRRAAAIADWLATEGGIERSRLQTKGYGETKPVAPNTKKDGSDNPDGRAKNRRVVISAQSK